MATRSIISFLGTQLTRLILCAGFTFASVEASTASAVNSLGLETTKKVGWIDLSGPSHGVGSYIYFDVALRGLFKKSVDVVCLELSGDLNSEEVGLKLKKSIRRASVKFGKRPIFAYVHQIKPSQMDWLEDAVDEVYTDNKTLLKSIDNGHYMEYSDWRSLKSELLLRHSIHTFHNSVPRLLSYLVHPSAILLLFLGAFFSIFLEMIFGEHRLFGLISLTCVGFILYVNISLDTIGWLEFGLMGAGVFLACLELFWLPGKSVVGIAGMTLCLLSSFMILLPTVAGIDLFSSTSWEGEVDRIMDFLGWFLLVVSFGFTAAVTLIRSFSTRFLAPFRRNK